MTESERSIIAFRWVLACVIIAHCEHMNARRKVQGALYYLKRKGIVERVGKDQWRAVKK